MAIIGADLTYDYHLDELVKHAYYGNSEAISQKKQKLKDEVRKYAQSEVQRLIADMLGVLYNSDYEKLYADIAKMALIGTKETYSNIEKITVLSFIWGRVSKYYEDSPEEFRDRIKNPVRGLYLLNH